MAQTSKQNDVARARTNFLELPKSLRVRTKLILLLIAVAYFSIFLISTVSFNIGKSIINNQIQTELKLSTENVMNSINKFIYDRFNDMQLLISDSVLSSTDTSVQEKTEMLRSSLVKLGWYSNFYLTDTEGTIIASTLKLSVGQSMRDYEWYEKTRENFIHVSDVTVSPFTGKKVLVFGNTVVDKNNNLVGAIFANLPIEIIGDFIKKNPAHLGIYLLAKDGEVLAHKESSGSDGVTSLDQNNHYRERDSFIREKIESKGYFGFQGNGWSLIAQIPESIAYAPIERFSFFLWGSLFIISVGIIFMGNLIGKKLVKPIETLAAGVAKVAQGELNEKIPANSQDEFGYLATNFNKMTDSLAEKNSKLLEEKGKYKSILESSNEGIILFNRENQVIAFNKKFGELFNLKSAKGTIRDIFTSFHKKEVEEECRADMERVKALIRNNDFTKSFSVEMAFKKPYRILHLYTKPVSTETGELLGRIWVFRDITQEREAEKTQNDFISIASHRLRTPLTVINWNVQMLGDKTFGRLSTEQRAALDRIEKGADHLSGLIKILLNSAEIKKNAMNITLSVFSLKEIMQKVERKIKKEFSENFEKKELELTMPNWKKIGLANVKADQEKLEHILHILIRNACLYGKKGETNRVVVAVAKDPQKPKWVVSVKDSGIGIPEMEQPKIFTKFFRGEKASTIYTQGTGLSLFLAKIFTNSAGEKIGFETDEKNGTVFSFTVQKA